MICCYNVLYGIPLVVIILQSACYDNFILYIFLMPWFELTAMLIHTKHLCSLNNVCYTRDYQENNVILLVMSSSRTTRWGGESPPATWWWVGIEIVSKYTLSIFYLQYMEKKFSSSLYLLRPTYSILYCTVMD